MDVRCLFALMIYCNYDVVQYEFSKTFRCDTDKHTNFWHLGRFLRTAVLEYGTTIKAGVIKSFYHGISEKLLFQKIGYVKINSPLSTSSSIVVAANFASDNGLIIEFGAGWSGRTISQ